MSATETALDVHALFDTYAATFATREPDAIAALHSPDTQFWLHTDREPVRGRVAVRDQFAEFFRQWPQFGFVVHRVITGDRHWILDWALTSVLTGPAGTSHQVRFDCLDIVTLDEHGLVERKDTYVDYVQAEAALTNPTP